ncbi:hypothetical protein J7E95_33940, partial [Streptomyces sp. ISL-14]|nr:hypothetical protein [Streptomyces sp. ISL-14]
ASTHRPKETLVRAPTLLAATVLAGTVLLGGAGQALAYDSDDMSNAGAGFGNSSPATPGLDQDDSGFGQGASGAGEGASGSDQDASGFDQDATGFDLDESGFDRTIGH